jgi:hypothetical protein
MHVPEIDTHLGMSYNLEDVRTQLGTVVNILFL